jgi:tRNA threonylcarbamoyladenosine modification (KEOPS) complex Cgi121 subunit
MIRYIEEYRKYVEITGYMEISFAEAEVFLKANRKQAPQHVEIQFFDAELIATPEHLYFAVLNALQAFLQKTNISKSVAMETMLYASAQSQIQKSIDILGIKKTTKNMAVTIIGSDPKQIEDARQELTSCIGRNSDETVLQMSKHKQENIKQAFSITNEELHSLTKDDIETAIVDLVIERIALLATEL